MSGETLDPSAWLVVEFQSEREQVARIMTILTQLGIAGDVVGSGTAAAGPPAVAVRVPAERLVAAVLALEQQGFQRVKAYGGQADR